MAKSRRGLCRYKVGKGSIFGGYGVLGGVGIHCLYLFAYFYLALEFALDLVDGLFVEHGVSIIVVDVFFGDFGDAGVVK